MLFSCGSTTKSTLTPKVIVYKIPYKVEQLLIEQIESKPKKEYCILIEKQNESIFFKLVDNYSHYHKYTSYRALIGEEYYPISFPQFDMRYGIINDSKEFLKTRNDDLNTSKGIGKQSYPMYHGLYKVEVDSKNNILFEGYVY